MEKVYVLVTMDCERPVSDTGGLQGKPRHGRQSGPEDTRLSRRFIQGYWDVAQQFGFPVTFFIHPELAADHSDLFLALEKEGACLGLHLHPWKFANGRYAGHFGGFSKLEQLQMLSEAMLIWEQGFGRRPLYFRPGSFSANDSTFPVLEQLGFVGGSVSCPGRIWPEFASVWAGAERHPHRAHAHFRHWAGDLAFVNIPLTVDITEPLQAPGGSDPDAHKTRIDGEPALVPGMVHGYHDLRPDRDVDHPRLVRNIVRQLVVDQPAVKTISLVTHNDHDFADPGHPWTIRLKRTLAAIHDACRDAGLEAVGSTVSEVCRLVLGTQ